MATVEYQVLVIRKDVTTGNQELLYPINRVEDVAGLQEALDDLKVAAGKAIGWDDVLNKPTSYPPSSHKHQDSDIVSVSASKIKGVLSLDQIPAGALERMYSVANEGAMLALTTAQVQNGDVVKVLDTDPPKLYYVVNDTKLNSLTEGYQEFASGIASAVEWSNVMNKPQLYNKSEVDSRLANKRDVSDSYSKSEIDNGFVKRRYTDFQNGKVLTYIYPASGSYGFYPFIVNNFRGGMCCFMDGLNNLSSISISAAGHPGSNSGQPMFQIFPDKITWNEQNVLTEASYGGAISYLPFVRNDQPTFFSRQMSTDKYTPIFTFENASSFWHEQNNGPASYIEMHFVNFFNNLPTQNLKIRLALGSGPRIDVIYYSGSRLIDSLFFGRTSDNRFYLFAHGVGDNPIYINITNALYSDTFSGKIITTNMPISEPLDALPEGFTTIASCAINSESGYYQKSEVNAKLNEKISRINTNATNGDTYLTVKARTDRGGEWTYPILYKTPSDYILGGIGVSTNPGNTASTSLNCIVISANGSTNALPNNVSDGLCITGGNGTLRWNGKNVVTEDHLVSGHWNTSYTKGQSVSHEIYRTDTIYKRCTMVMTCMYFNIVGGDYGSSYREIAIHHLATNSGITLRTSYLMQDDNTWNPEKMSTHRTWSGPYSSSGSDGVSSLTISISPFNDSLATNGVLYVSWVAIF